MSVIVEGVYDSGIVKLKTKVEASNDTEVLVIFKDKPDKEKFLQSAGSWADVDESIIKEIYESRRNLRERDIEI